MDGKVSVYRGPGMSINLQPKVLPKPKTLVGPVSFSWSMVALSRTHFSTFEPGYLEHRRRSH